jgi:hypothetical protein
MEKLARSVVPVGGVLLLLAVVAMFAAYISIRFRSEPLKVAAAAPASAIMSTDNEEETSAQDKVKLDQVPAPSSLVYPAAYKSHLALKPQPPTPYQFKIPFVMQSGIPLIAVRVMSQRDIFVCVADTGSMHLNISSSVCRRCDGKYGSYAPTEELLKAPTEELRYGTQHDVVSKVNDLIQLHLGPTAFPTPVHVAVRRDKALSNYNVFGLLDARDDNEGLASAILGDSNELIVRFGTPTGVVAGVNLAAARLFQSRASAVARLVKSSMGFYIVRLTGLWAGDVKVPTTTQLVIVDTGSNMTSFPRTTYSVLEPLLQHGQPLTLELDGQAVRIQSRHLFWENTRMLMLDDDLSVLGRNASDYMILGSYCMQGHQLLFGRDKLCIAPSASGKIELL